MIDMLAGRDSANMQLVWHMINVSGPRGATSHDLQMMSGLEQEDVTVSLLHMRERGLIEPTGEYRTPVIGGVRSGVWRLARPSRRGGTWRG